MMVLVIWRMNRATFEAEFVAWMDKLIAETPIGDAPDMEVGWRNALRAEKSGAPY
jgi:hypothetical protein